LPFPFLIIIGLIGLEEWGRTLFMLGTMLAVGGGFWLLQILAVPPWYLKIRKTKFALLAVIPPLAFIPCFF